MSAPSRASRHARPAAPPTPRPNPGRAAPVALAAALLALAPCGARAAAISVEGGAVVLGRTDAAALLLEVEEGPGVEPRPLRAAVNVGLLSEPERVAPGRYRARYVPPRTRFPQVALVALWRDGAQDGPVEFVRLPLLGTTRVTVKARPGRSVVAKVGGAEFGPVTAGPTGEAVVSIAAPPGERTAIVTVAGEKGPVTREVALETPPYSRLAAVALPPAERDGRGRSRLEVFHDAPGAEAPPDHVKVTASEGEIVLERAAAGRYTFRHVAPAETDAAEVRFTVQVEGDPSARAEARLALGRVAPRAISIAVSGAPLEAGSGAAARATVVLLGDGGIGLAGRDVSVTAGGLPVRPVVDRGGGVYEAQVIAPATSPERGVLELRAEVPREGASRLAATAELPVRARAPAPPPAPTVAAAAEPAVASLQTDPRPLYLGVRAGWSHSLGDLAGARLGVDAWMHVFPETSQVASRVGIGLSLSHGSAERTVTDAAGALSARSSAHFFPLSARVGYDVWAARRASATAGLGFTFAMARFTSSLGPSSFGVGAGFLGFLSTAFSAGPGQLFAEASYGNAPVSTPDFRVETGGLTVEAGYRVRVH